MGDNASSGPEPPRPSRLRQVPVFNFARNEKGAGPGAGACATSSIANFQIVVHGTEPLATASGQYQVIIVGRTLVKLIITVIILSALPLPVAELLIVVVVILLTPLAQVQRDQGQALVMIENKRKVKIQGKVRKW